MWQPDHNWKYAGQDATPDESFVMCTFVAWPFMLYTIVGTNTSSRRTRSRRSGLFLLELELIKQATLNVQRFGRSSHDFVPVRGLFDLSRLLEQRHCNLSGNIAAALNRSSRIPDSIIKSVSRIRSTTAWWGIIHTSNSKTISHPRVILTFVRDVVMPFNLPIPWTLFRSSLLVSRCGTQASGERFRNC